PPASPKLQRGELEFTPMNIWGGNDREKGWLVLSIVNYQLSIIPNFITSSMSSLAIIIPNWNGRKVLKKCLDSLRIQTFKDFETYVVDNGSSDKSNRMIAEDYPEVRLIKLKENTGFAKANNIGIRQAIKDDAQANNQKEQKLKYICPLNNDIELNAHYLEEMVMTAKKYQKENGKLGILAAKLFFKYEPQLINTVGTLIQIDGSGMERGFREKDQGQYEETKEIFGSCGAAALYSVKMLQEIAYKNRKGEDCYFDEDFFAYYEDLDLNYRSRLLGYKAYYVPKAFAYHVHSATGKSFSPFKSFHVHRNQYYVLIKNFPLPYLIRGLLFMPFRYIMLIASAFSNKGPSAKLKKNTQGKGILKIVLASWWGVIKNLGGLLKKRQTIQKNKKVSWKEFDGWLKDYKADLKKMIFG
ncbi:MAG: glycosyltransferase family 2 protein, partial [Patescibacteria group bacterium]|nr:glycosyltransferase family 2 protein [Patescibacteria group bacterium]